MDGGEFDTIRKDLSGKNTAGLCTKNKSTVTMKQEALKGGNFDTVFSSSKGTTKPPTILGRELHRNLLSFERSIHLIKYFLF